MRKEFESPRINRESQMLAKQVVKSKQRLVSIPKEDLESLEATIETLQDKYVIEHLEKSEQDIREGRTRNIDELIKELKRH